MNKYRSRIRRFGSLDIENGAAHPNNLLMFFEYILRLLLALIIVLAILGFFGSGLLTKVKITNGMLSATFDKFIRAQATNSFIINVNFLNQNTSNAIQIWVSQDLMKKAYIKNISPRPLFEKSQSDGIIYTFNIGLDIKKFDIIFTIEPLSAGILTQKIAINNNPPLIFRQIIYP